MTLQPVHVVTDSTASLPPELVERWGLTVVPLVVRFGETQGREGVDLSSSDVLARLAIPVLEHAFGHEQFHRAVRRPDLALGDHLAMARLEIGTEHLQEPQRQVDVQSK